MDGKGSAVVLTIVDIISPAEQGQTRPFLCRADDGQTYFVKRAGIAGHKALIAEWLAGHLARQLNLPVPAFDIAEVPPSLLALLPAEERRAWGTSPAFASKKVENVVELRFTDIAKVPVGVQAQVLLFDAWIGNADRCLCELVRAREGLLTFGPAGALLADTPETALEDLHQRLVRRQFAQPTEHHEEVMRKRLATCLRTWNLTAFYHRATIGDDQFHVPVPFVHSIEGKAQKILRPLDLDRDDTTGIYKHGDQWLLSMRRLQRFNTLPERVVIPVRLPVAGERRDAANQVIEEFTTFGALAIPIEDQDALLEAAKVA